MSNIHTLDEAMRLRDYYHSLPSSTRVRCLARKSGWVTASRLAAYYGEDVRAIKRRMDEI